MAAPACPDRQRRRRGHSAHRLRWRDRLARGRQRQRRDHDAAAERLARALHRRTDRGAQERHRRHGLADPARQRHRPPPGGGVRRRAGQAFARGCAPPRRQSGARAPTHPGAGVAAADELGRRTREPVLHQGGPPRPGGVAVRAPVQRRRCCARGRRAARQRCRRGAVQRRAQRRDQRAAADSRGLR